MDVDDFFRRYAQDRRSMELPSFRREAFDHLVRYTAEPPGDEGFVAFARLAPATEQAAIREQVDHFRRLGQAFEWKVYALDRPGNLRRLLHDEGFVADDEETFMVFDLSGRSPRGARVGAAVAGLDDVLAVQQAVWGDRFDGLRRALSNALRSAPDTVSVYCAYLHGRPVGSGWIDFPPGSRFPELHGGSVVGDARGRGVYSALFTRRLDEAATRSYAHVCVDASDLSRPILRNIGFEVVCTTVPMWMRFEDH